MPCLALPVFRGPKPPEKLRIALHRSSLHFISVHCIVPSLAESTVRAYVRFVNDEYYSAGTVDVDLVPWPFPFALTLRITKSAFGLVEQLSTLSAMRRGSGLVFASRYCSRWLCEQNAFR